MISIFSLPFLVLAHSQTPELSEKAIVVSGGGDMGSNDRDFIADLHRATSDFFCKRLDE